MIGYEGVTPVTNPGPAPPARLDLVVSIGPKTLTDTGSPDEFGRVSSVALGPDEEVFVADRLNREIRVFGLDGVHHSTFGRMGEGPGEFQSLKCAGLGVPARSRAAVRGYEQPRRDGRHAGIVARAVERPSGVYRVPARAQLRGEKT